MFSTLRLSKAHSLTRYCKYFHNTSMRAGRDGPYGPDGHPFFRKHKKGGATLWRIMSLYVALPGVIVMSYKTYANVQAEHACYKRPEFVAYDHLRIRTKRFPWGDGNKTFFHNPEKNALPGGYEDGGEEGEEEEEEEEEAVNEEKEEGQGEEEEEEEDEGEGEEEDEAEEEE